jgi:iron-sulfur cluster repair protein YtfE (RIC family)
MSDKRTPLKRHVALQPLSREHHEALILAQLLKSDVPDYKGLPTTVEGQVDYTLKKYEWALEPHFRKEEEVLIPKVLGFSKELDELCVTIEEEHRAIREAVGDLQHAGLGEAAALLDALGRLLEAHVRREERTWFALIQETVPEEVLREFKLRG